MNDDPQVKLKRLLSFLEQDPGNPNLLRDAGETALAANEREWAHRLFTQLGEAADLTDQDKNFAGIAAMRSGHHEDAIVHFRDLLENYEGDAGLGYNLAHSLALSGDHPAAEMLLTDDMTQDLPQAATLKLEILHQDGRYDEASELVEPFLEKHGDYAPLLAAVSVLAIDLEDEDLARRCAERAGEHPDALTTLATLKLGDQDSAGAEMLFHKALSLNSSPQPRALIGLGLSAMISGDMVKAGKFIDDGAEIFEDHLGSWIAAGWAHLLAGDRETARARFQHALDLDENFAESHGSLAVLDMMEGQMDLAKQRAEIASRLDRNSFSTALANSMILASQGDGDKAARIIEMALQQPVDDKGRTIGEALAMNMLRNEPAGSA